jgi:hypothetical protein
MKKAGKSAGTAIQPVQPGSPRTHPDVPFSVFINAPDLVSADGSAISRVVTEMVELPTPSVTAVQAMALGSDPQVTGPILVQHDDPVLSNAGGIVGIVHKLRESSRGGVKHPKPLVACANPNAI